MHAVRARRRADPRGPTTPGAGPAGSSEEIRVNGLKEIQYHPGVIEGCLAGTGLTLDQTENPTDIMN
jgi:hypothetical protein